MEYIYEYDYEYYYNSWYDEEELYNENTRYCCQECEYWDNEILNNH